MNVTDVNETPAVADRLVAIFERQAELAEKYEGIERKNGLGRGLLPAILDLDDPRVQYVIKDYAWRVVEEIGEAYSATESLEHAHEEVADGLHFLVELCELVRIGPDDLVGEKYDDARYDGDRLDYIWFGGTLNLSDNIAEFIGRIGMACCALKNKPWKQTHFPTDKCEFRRRMISAFKSYIKVASSWGMSKDDLFSMYFKKSRVNDFRIQSNY